MYNNLNQLTKSTATATWEYSYDDNGNLTKKYKDANNLTAYYWDSRNLMTKVTVTTGGSSTDHTFTYDALGRRESMTSGGTTTDYMYEGLRVLTEKTGSLTKRYTNGPQAVGGIISQDDGTNTTYYHYDALGNVLLTSDGDDYVDETFVQDAYGNIISGTASGYHLTTKEYFPAFVLYYFNARWYDPETGRFVSKDPIHFADGPNLYIYVLNNPILFYDPTGKGRVPGRGKLCIQRNCKPNDECPGHKPETDGTNEKPDKLPYPAETIGRGQPKYKCRESDGLYTSSGIVKIPDNCNMFIDCDSKGKIKNIWYLCLNKFFRNMPQLPTLYPPGNKPDETWPDNPYDNFPGPDNWENPVWMSL